VLKKLAGPCKSWVMRVAKQPEIFLDIEILRSVNLVKKVIHIYVKIPKVRGLYEN